MSDAKAIAEFARAIDRPLRQARDPEVFQVFRDVAEVFHIIGFEERLDSVGIDDSDLALYELDAGGRVVSLALDGLENDHIDHLRRFPRLETLIVDTELDVHAAHIVASLERVEVLWTSIAPGQSAQVLDALRHSQSIHSLLFIEADEPPDIGPLAHMPQLHTLLTGKQPTDPAAVANLTSLKSLWIELNDEHHGLQLPEGLISLGGIWDDSIDLDFIGRCPTIRHLNSTGRAIPLSQLRALPDLITLSTEVDEPTLEPLTFLTQLEHLNVGGRLETLSHVDQFPRLRSLDLSLETIDLTPLVGNQRLAFVKLRGAVPTTLPDQLNMPSLTHLDWENSGTSDLVRIDDWEPPGRTERVSVTSADFLRSCPRLSPSESGPPPPHQHRLCHLVARPQVTPGAEQRGVRSVRSGRTHRPSLRRLLRQQPFRHRRPWTVRRSPTA